MKALSESKVGLASCVKLLVFLCEKGGDVHSLKGRGEVRFFFLSTNVTSFMLYPFVGKCDSQFHIIFVIFYKPLQALNDSLSHIAKKMTRLTCTCGHMATKFFLIGFKSFITEACSMHGVLIYHISWHNFNLSENCICLNSERPPRFASLRR